MTKRYTALLLWFLSGQLWSQSTTLNQLPEQADTAFIHRLIEATSPFIDNYQGDSAMAYASAVIDLSHKIEYAHGLGSGHRDIAIMLWLEDHLDSALHHSELAKEFFQAAGDSARLMTQLYLNGMILKAQSKYEAAMSLFYEVLLYYERTQHRNTGKALNMIAAVHDVWRDTLLVESIYKRAIEFERQYGNKRGLTYPMNNLALHYKKHGRYPEALSLFEECLEINREVNPVFGVAFSTQHIGEVYALQGKLEEALAYEREALTLHRQVGHRRPIMFNVLSLGELYMQLQQPTIARRYFEEADSLAQSIGSTGLLERVYRGQAEVYAMLGRYQQAYTYTKLASDMRDTLFTQEKTASIERLTQQFEAEKKETEIAQLEAENELKDTVIQNDRQVKIGLGIGAVLVGIIGLLGWNTQRSRLQHERSLNRKNEELQAAAFKQTLTELELKALRAQMNPHFIFNCMNSIHRLILEGKNDQAARSLTKFSKLIRQILEHSEKQRISLEAELDMLEAYIQLEAQRFKDKISYEIKLGPGLDPEEVELPSMVLQPFIENAIWHGLMHKEGAEGKIFIGIEERNELLHCTIEDNGIGREKALQLRQKTPISHKSMAMAVTRDRLGLLDKSGLEDLIRIIDLKDATNRALGTRVEVSIPL